MSGRYLAATQHLSVGGRHDDAGKGFDKEDIDLFDLQQAELDERKRQRWKRRVKRRRITASFGSDSVPHATHHIE